MLGEGGADNLLNRYDLGDGEVIRAELAGNADSFYFSDAQGSTTALSNLGIDAPSFNARYAYDAWGNITSSSGDTTANAIGYTGQRHDNETGLMALGNGERYYAPGLGRFIQQDSWTGLADMAQSMNRYAYADGNPTRYTDPTGHGPEPLQDASTRGLHQNRFLQATDSDDAPAPSRRVSRARHAKRTPTERPPARPQTTQAHSQTPFEICAAAPTVVTESRSDASATTPVPNAPAQEQGVNYLRDPLSSDHWILNGLSNTVSDLLFLDSIAEWSWTAGDYRRSASERAWAATKAVAVTAATVFGGQIAKGVSKVAAPVIARVAETAAGRAIGGGLTRLAETGAGRAANRAWQKANAPMSELFGRGGAKAENAVARLESTGGRLLPPEPKTPGLGEYSSIKELLETGALPGDIRMPGGGVILTDKTIRLGDLYKLSTFEGRRIEFSLTREMVDGKRAFKLYSGAADNVVTPKSARIIGHTHPTPHPNQVFPSPGDMRKFNADYFNELTDNPVARPKPSRIIWGEGNTGNTVFYSGFHKDY